MCGGSCVPQSTKRKVLSGKPVYNRRYFILQGAEPGDASLQCARLVWYETNQSSKARDSVELTRECSARSLSGMDKPLHRKFHLELTVPGKRVFVLRASSADSRDEWIVAMERAISATRVDESTGMSKPNSPAVRMGEVEDEEDDVEVDQRPVILLQPAPEEGGGKQPPAGVSTAVQAGEDTAAVGDSKPRAEDGKDRHHAGRRAGAGGRRRGRPPPYAYGLGRRCERPAVLRLHVAQAVVPWRRREGRRARQRWRRTPRSTCRQGLTRWRTRTRYGAGGCRSR